ncbi:hypothetical protein PENTCL1PPCAC_18974, partial [Pristionchus entomophagus]
AFPSRRVVAPLSPLSSPSHTMPGAFTKTAVPVLDGLIILILPILTLLANGIIFITITHFAGKDLSRPATEVDLEALKDVIPDDNNASGRSVKTKKKGKSKKGGQSATSRKKSCGKNAMESAEAKTGKSTKGFTFTIPEKEDVGTLVAPVQA